MPTGESSFTGQAEPSDQAQGYPVTVTVYQEDGTTPRANAVVRLTHKGTGDYVDATANGSGVATFSLDDLDRDFFQGDLIKVEQIRADADQEYYVSANGDESNPSWVEVANNTRTQIYPNSIRLQVDTTNYPAGRNADLTVN